MLWKFCIFSGHLPKHCSCFSSNIPDTPRHVLHLTCLFQIFWTFSSSLICVHFPDAPEIPHLFQNISPSTRNVFFWIFRTFSGHILHLVYLFWIFRTFSSSFICAHSPDAPEVLHLFRDIYLSTGAVFFPDIPDTPRTCITFDIFISDISDIKHLIYLCMLQKFHIFLGHLPEHKGCFFFGYSGHSQDMCYI